MRMLPLLLAVACAAPEDPAPAPTDAGTTADAGDPPDTVLAATTYCEAIEPFFCRFYLRCGRIAAADPAACKRIFIESCEAKYEPKWAGLAAAHLVELHSAGLLACERHLDTVACDDQVLDLDGPCAQIWQGTQPEGSHCGFDTDAFVCAPGTRCVLGLDFCGTCRRIATGDEACGSGVACPSDATCFDGKCAVRGKRGATCGDGLVSCALGLSCASGICTAPIRSAAGAPCDQGRRCPYATACVDGTCLAQAMAGEACTKAPGCASGWCGDDSRCAAPLAGGSACVSSSECASGLCLGGRCDAIPGRCLVTQ